jgi:hypothetical protein
LSWVSRDQQARTARFYGCDALQGLLIIAIGQFDKDRELWMPIADISRGSAIGRECHAIKDSIDCFGTKLEAETFAIEIAKAWVDARFKAA